MPSATLTAGLLAALITVTGASAIAPVPYLPFALAQGAALDSLATAHHAARDVTRGLWPAIRAELEAHPPVRTFIERPRGERMAETRGGAVAHAIWVALPARERHLEF